ncbi:MAG: SRPBCC family protein [Maricaulaceae bacterium]|jgi:effector-binding domain-containing protein
MKWLVRTFFAVTIIALAALIGGLFLPGRAHVERSVSIDRPPATVYTMLSSLRTFHDWSPWAEIEPEATFGFDGPAFGEGARYVWSGDQIGTGELILTAAEPYESVAGVVDLGPRGRARMTFDVEPKPGGSVVTWSYDAEFGLDIIGRYAGRLFGREVGRRFEDGLVNLKEQAERLPGADFAEAGAEIVTVAPQPAVVLSRQVRGDAAAQEAAFADALDEVRGFMAANGLSEAGPVVAVTHRWEPPLWVFDVAVPYAGAQRGGEDAAVEFGQTPGGRAARAIHRGPVGGVARLNNQLDAFLAAHRLVQSGSSWEVRVTEREDTAPEDQVTEVYIPVE